MANLKNTNINDNLELPQGTTGERPSSPEEGQIRYNTDTEVTEFYNGENWRPLSDTHPEAEGGTVVDTDIGGVPYRIHFYRNVGTENFSVTNPGAVDILVVGGGGAGGSDNSGSDSAGGGGGGGIVFYQSLFLATGNYSVTVGDGGAGVLEGSDPIGDGERGEDTVFSGPSASISAFGGGGGLRGDPGGQAPTYTTYGAGGGGGTRGSLGAPATSQGNAGGDSQNPGGFDGLLAGGGGGGSRETAADISGGQGGNYSFWFTTNFGENGIFAGGGGGGSSARNQGGAGGLGGGGTGHLTTSAPGDPGIDGTGGGGGASDGGYPGGNGGSGIVIVRYPRNSSLDTEPARIISASQPNNLNIIYNGLNFLADASNPISYPGSGTQWQDTIQGLQGSLENGASFDSKKQGVFVFDGDNDYINFGSISGNYISNPSLNNNVMSFSVWALVNNGYYILSSGSQTGSTGMTFSYQNGVPFVSVKGENQIAEISPFDFPLGTWHHWFFVSDGSTLKGYIDGTLFNSANFGSSSETDSQTFLTVGTPNNSRGNLTIDGEVGQITFYNRALSDQEVRHNFNVTRGRFGV